MGTDEVRKNGDFEALFTEIQRAKLAIEIDDEKFQLESEDIYLEMSLLQAQFNEF